MRITPVLLTLLLATPLVGACGVDGDCTGTGISAEDASRVDLGGDGDSTVLHGRLTSDGKGLAGQPIRLTLHADSGDDLFHADLRSTRAGRIVYDLEGRIDPKTTPSLDRATSFDLDFDGDATYCSSSDTGDFRLAGAG